MKEQFSGLTMNKKKDDIEFLDESGSSAVLRRIQNNPFLAVGK